MAKNLRAKIPATDTLIVRDVNEKAIKSFVAETEEAARSSGAGANENRVEVAKNAREIAEKSVSMPPMIECRIRCAAAFFHIRLYMEPSIFCT